jgi:DNA-binding beta-propeller fold protein YncE
MSALFQAIRCAAAKGLRSARLGLSAARRGARALPWLGFCLGLGWLPSCARRPAEPALAVREAHVWNVPAEGTKLPSPRSVGLCGDRELAVLDTAGRVLIYATNGVLARQWSMPEIAAGKPEGVVSLRDGTVVVCDTHYHRVVEFGATGEVARTFGREGQGAGEFIYPVAVCVDTQEQLYVAEYGSNDRVQVFTRDGRYVRAFGRFGTAPGEFQRPSGLAWKEGRVYVVDAFNNRIQVFTEQGQFEAVLPTPPLRSPYDLKLDPQGALLVVEYGAGRITRLAADGRLLGRTGSTGTALGQFVTPWGLAVTAAGHVVVADTGNRRLVELAIE